MREGAITQQVVFAVFSCINSLCARDEFVDEVPPIYSDMPACPECATHSVLVDVLYRGM